MHRIFIFLTCLFFLATPLFSQEWGSNQTNTLTKAHRRENGYRILTLDGGGIRGVFSAQLLAMLEEEFHFLQHVDLFVGTSTGSILACALAYGIPPNEIVNFYRTHAKGIFTEKGGLYSYFPLDLLQAKYNRDYFQDILESIFPKNLQLSQLPKKVVCISFQLYNPTINCWSPSLEDNFDPEVAKRISVTDAILRSTAAPTYFPSYQGHIDGGAVANNPAMMGLTRALDMDGACVALEDIRMLSVGTGIVNNYIPEDVDWGGYGWMIHASFPLPTPPHPLLDILYNGNISVPHYQCSRLLNSHYFRLNTFLSNDLLLDDWHEVDFLIEEAKRLPENSPEEWNNLRKWVVENFLQ